MPTWLAPLPLNTGGVANMPEMAEMPTPDGRVLRNISAATLTPCLPAPEQATGAAAVVLPGGGFRVLALDLEGTRVAEALAAKGIAAFVLQYRLRPTPADPQAFGQEMDHFMAELASGHAAPDLSVPPQALADVAAALRLVRAQATAWQLNPQRTGLMGFSAGAQTALNYGLNAAPDDAPAFIASIYGPMGTPPASTAAATLPPLYAAMAADDPLFARQGFGLLDRWIGRGGGAAGVGDVRGHQRGQRAHHGRLAGGRLQLVGGAHHAVVGIHRIGRHLGQHCMRSQHLRGQAGEGGAAIGCGGGAGLAGVAGVVVVQVQADRRAADRAVDDGDGLVDQGRRGRRIIVAAAAGGQQQARGQGHGQQPGGWAVCCCGSGHGGFLRWCGTA